MKLGRKLHWDPIKERFKNDDEANAMLSRPQRAALRDRGRRASWLKAPGPHMFSGISR